MIRSRFLISAAVALVLYGLFGLFTAAAMLVVGRTTFEQVASLQVTLESERVALVQSVRTISVTVHDTAGAASDFRRRIDTARGAADQASRLANDSAGTFRDMGTSVASITILGIQPLAGLSPEFDHSADQLQQLAISLGLTREALGQNGVDIQRVAVDLNLLQTQLDTVATTLSQPGVLGLDPRGLVSFQLPFYGMCLLVVLQSAFSIVAGVALYRLQHAPAAVAETDAKQLSLAP
jgi:hypothetical protein